MLSDAKSPTVTSAEKAVVKSLPQLVFPATQTELLGASWGFAPALGVS